MCAVTGRRHQLVGGQAGRRQMSSRTGESRAIWRVRRAGLGLHDQPVLVCHQSMMCLSAMTK